MRTLLIVLLSVATIPVLADEVSHAGGSANWGTAMMHDQPFWMVMLDRLEYRDGDHGDDLLWDAQGWYGGDYRKLWIEAEGHAEGGAIEDAEVQLLYDRLVSPFWSIQGGVRYDYRPDAADVSYLSLGLQGLAPQWLEADLAAFLSEDGDLSVRGELEYDLRLTQRLVLQPRLELAASFSDAPELSLASGVTSTQAGLRLRYEVRREFAPYLGVSWTRLHGDTRHLARADGEPGSVTRFVIGVRAWF